MFDLGNIVGVSGLTTPALTWKFSGVEQAWMAAGLGVLVNVAGAIDQNGVIIQRRTGVSIKSREEKNPTTGVYTTLPTVIKNGLIGHREETRE